MKKNHFKMSDLLNIALNQAFSDVIGNQEKEIKCLNNALNQAKEEINDIFLKIEEQNEIFGSE